MKTKWTNKRMRNNESSTASSTESTGIPAKGAKRMGAENSPTNTNDSVSVRDSNSESESEHNQTDEDKEQPIDYSTSQAGVKALQGSSKPTPNQIPETQNLDYSDMGISSNV